MYENLTGKNSIPETEIHYCREILPNLSKFFWEFCRKFVLGTYNWRTFDDVAIEANIIGQAFKNLGVKAKDRIAILAETRAEWVTNIYIYFIINFIFFKKYIYFFFR